MTRRRWRLRETLCTWLEESRRPAARPPKTRFRPRLEGLEDRRLLVAAVDLADITGRVFDDFSGNGFDAGEEVSGAPLDLYLDDGDGVFEPGGGTGGDSVVRMTMSGTDGRYTFGRLTAGSYFVLQPAGTTASGTPLVRSVSPLITITGNDVRGQIVTVIDSFEQTFQTARDETAGDGPVTSIAAAPTAEVIGGERELIVEKTSQDGAVSLSVDDPLLANRLAFDSVLNGQGPRRIVWDGTDNDAATIDDLGLGGVDLASTSEGIQLQIRADLMGGTATIRVYSDDGGAGTANRFSAATIPIPPTTGSFLSAEFLPFDTATFTETSGGGADFTSVGAIELVITGAADVNGAAEVVGTVGTIAQTADFDNFDQADLSLSKSVDDATPSLNQEVTYTITVNNVGPDGATGVVVTDVLPDGIEFVRSTTASGAYQSTTGLWTIGSIASGTTASLDIVGRVTSVGTKTNTAEITASDQFDPNSIVGNGDINEDDQASIALTPETIDLELSKTASTQAPNVGQSVTFVITLENRGPSTATNVTVRDLLPAGLTLTGSDPQRGNYETTTGNWTVPSLASGESLTLELTGVVTTNGSFTNTAEVIAADQSDTDSTPGNNNAGEDDLASVTVTTQLADLSLAKTVNDPDPNVGDEVVFTVSLANEGPDTATGVVVTDLLPAGLTAISSTTNTGTYSETTGLWTVGNVTVGATPTLDIRARVVGSDAVTNTAQITSVDQFDPDSSPANNVPGEDDQASVTIDPPTIDLSLTKTIDTPRPNVGDEIVYTIRLANAGPDSATGIVVSDPVPIGLTFLDATESVGTYSPVTGNWTVDSLAAGGNATLDLRARVDVASGVSNTALVQAANEFDIDSTPGNNVPTEDDQATVAFTLASADLSITKSVNNPAPNVGQDVTFTVVVSNAGPDAATDISVRDQLPVGTSFVSSNPSAGTYSEVTGIWQIPSIASGSSATLVLVATAETNNLATNTAEIIAVDQLDPDSTPGNGSATEDDIATASIQAQQIDLSLTKTISDPAPNVGDEISFFITVSNEGPNDATAVSVTDRLPAGITALRAVASQGSVNTTTGVWTVGSVAVGAQPTLEIVARVDQVLGDTVNTAEITAAGQPDVDSTPANDIESEDDQASVTFRTPVADLSLTKTVTNNEPNLGERITFQIQLDNAGPDAATGIQVTDLLPAGLQFESTSLSAGTYDETTGIWDIGTLASGSGATLGINATVTAQGQKTNTARVTSVDQFDPDSTPGNNVESEDDQDSVMVTPPVIDLSLEKTASPLRPSVGQTVTFTVTARNGGPADASGVVVTDVLPPGLAFVDSDPSAGTYNPGTGRWLVGAIESGAARTLEITATVDSFEPLVNSAEVTAANQFDSDSTPGNNVAGEDDQAAVTITPARADLSLIKTVDDDQPNFGQEVRFLLTLANAGPDAAGNITIGDPLPSGLTLVSSSPSLGNYDQTTGIWTLPTVAAGAGATLEIRATVDTQVEQTNTAEILTSNQFDPDSTPGNGDAAEDDQSSVTLTPQLVDLALAKMLDQTNPNVGDTVTFSLGLSNAGPSTATGVAVTDRLPDGLTFVSSVASQGSYSPTTGLWTVGSVIVGQQPTLEIVATVGNIRSATNTAEVSAADQIDMDSTPGNGVAGEDDQATATLTTQVADLSLAKTVNNASPNQDEVITFTVTLSNDGPDAATEVRVQERLPIGFTLVSSNPSLGSFDPITGIWNVPSLADSNTATLQIDARVTSPTPSTNVAEITASRQFDPDSTPGNALPAEDDLASVQVTPLVIDLEVAATVDNQEPLEGDTITMTFTTTNQGNTGATGVVVSALIPAGLTVLSATPQTGTYDVASGLWTIGSIGTGVTASLTVVAVVDTRGLKVIDVQVQEADQFDIDSTPGNDVETEDDETELVIRAPRLLNKRLFLAR